jgi:hypothetical protein
MCASRTGKRLKTVSTTPEAQLRLILFTEFDASPRTDYRLKARKIRTGDKTGEVLFHLAVKAPIAERYGLPRASGFKPIEQLHAEVVSVIEQRKAEVTQPSADLS